MSKPQIAKLATKQINPCTQLVNTQISAKVKYTFYASNGFYIVLLSNVKTPLSSYCYDAKIHNIHKGDSIVKRSGSNDFEVHPLQGQPFWVHLSDFQQN
jgi:hypothetical protein